MTRGVQEELGADPARRPDDFVLLARVRVDNIEQRLKSHFVKAGLRLR